jgi:hypothetical protein
MEQGEIYYGHLSKIKNPKKKFFVIAGININTDTVLLAIISSRAYFADQSPELHNKIIPLDPSCYSYLTRTSKLDCTKIEPEKVSNVTSGIKNKSFHCKGKLSEEDLFKMVKNLLSSDGVSSTNKRIIGGKQTDTVFEFLL